METEVKEYYKNYEASNEILRVHHDLAKVIASFKPMSVFEFGCGTGKNLKLLMSMIPKLHEAGIDISMKNIDKAHSVNFLDGCNLGDENALPNFKTKSYDVVFTCSVLDHIESIGLIVSEFKRIAKKAIVILETNDVIEKFYFPHDYESYGFTKMNYRYVSNEAKDADGAVYEIWVHIKE